VPKADRLDENPVFFATGGRINVKRLLVLRSIKNQGRGVRLDDNETRIPDARRADVTGVGAWDPHVEDLALPKSLKSGNLSLEIWSSGGVG
jgi:hypothetical protein